MLRRLFIAVLSVATLLTAAVWYCQLFALTGGGLQVTRSMRVGYSAFDWAVAASVSWKGGRPPGRSSMTATSYELPGTPISATLATMQHPDGSRVQLWIGRSPIWFLTAVVAGSWVGLRFMSRWRKRRGRRKCGLCVSCGYDLTGNESGVCPECGESVQHRSVM